MPCKFSRGDVVRLNDHGLQQLFGAVEPNKHMLQKEYELTDVGHTSIVEIGEIYEVKVDDEAMNRLLIDDTCFDLVRADATFFGAAKGIDEKKAASVAAEAVDAFWAFVASKYPEAKTGDLSPGLSALLEDAAKTAVSGWVTENVPEPAPEEGGESYSW